MNTTLELLAKLIGTFVIIYSAYAYGFGAALLAFVYGCAMTTYVLSEHIEIWWRNRGKS